MANEVKLREARHRAGSPRHHEALGLGLGLADVLFACQAPNGLWPMYG